MRSKFLIFIFSFAFILNIPTGFKVYASDLMLNQSRTPSINHPFAAFENYQNRGFQNIRMEILSMGMSADYKLALEYGSTLVRLGSIIFGSREQENLNVGRD